MIGWNFLSWMRTIGESGYGAPLWPKEYGGLSGEPWMLHVVREELGRHRLPLFGPNILGVGLALCSKGEIKGGALADGSFGPDRAAVTAHNAFHRRQADACAFEVLGPVQSLKNAE